MQASSANNMGSAMDIRTRMLVCLVSSIGIIFIESSQALGLMAVISAGYALAHGRIKVLMAAWCGVAAMFAMAMVCVRIMLIFWPAISQAGLGAFFNPFLRVVVLVNTILALAVSSRIQDVIDQPEVFGPALCSLSSGRSDGALYSRIYQ